MIPVRGYKGHKVGVLGLGRSGLAAAISLAAGGAIPICWDQDEESCEAARAQGLTVADLSKDKNWDGIISLVVSPGIPHLYPAPHPIVQMAWDKGVVVDNDIGLFFRSYGTDEWDQFDTLPKVVCVTGSNGKSTTTALIGHILEAVHRPVQIGGNIGRGVMDLEPGIDSEVVILELSSYQTDLARALAPDIGVFMNLTPDHLDRHGGMGGYFAAKKRLFVEGGPERAVIGVDELEGASLAALLRDDAKSGDPVIRISTNKKLQSDGWSVFARKGFLAEWRRGKQMASIDLRDIRGLPGAHNHQNACAAYAVCRSLGLAPRVIETALRTYPGLPHRCQAVAEIDGVLYVNDSKATNADAAEKALLAFKNIHWIAGGQGKDGGVSGLLPLMDRVKATYLVGASGPDFAAQLGDHPKHVLETIPEAVVLAAKSAEVGDVVLLAPAAASFDQFADFEARGDAFVNAVKALGSA